MPSAIVAFDGLLADSLPLRVHALREALAAEGVVVALQDVAEVLPGRTFAEAGELLAHGHTDPTVGELIALRASRAYGALVAHGVPFHPDAVLAVRTQAARGVRIVVRADSDRRHVEPLLALAGLDSVVGLLRCSDDLPRGAEPSLARSWTAIDSRLARLGIPVTERTAYEPTEATAARAAAYVSRVVLSVIP